MKVRVLGGGPAGLYSSLLLKQAHPAWEIALYERNPAGATYGWGVVFSDRTLTELREADPETYREITDAFVLWDAIDVHVKGELIRCEGHTFAGIARRHLLDILQRRCAALGVGLHFETPVDDPDALRADADLLIAADGVNSLTRHRHADVFRPATEQGETRFIWFGTDKLTTPSPSSSRRASTACSRSTPTPSTRRWAPSSSSDGGDVAAHRPHRDGRGGERRLLRGALCGPSRRAPPPARTARSG